ncbi:PAS domain-containing protein [Streptomyces sp. NPDC053048]|uniref:PAS domain-containing protein n=1 Tax=Streptomyces sp. NPDC053048 TaxID=3365694 RepID=UPI0037D522C6
MSSRPSRGAARLAAILDALPDALLLVNCNGTVVNANHIALETFEVPGTGLVGRGLLDLLPEFDSRRIPGGLRPPRDDPDGGRTKPTRMIARRTDGTQFPVEVTSANLEDGRTPYAEPHTSSYDDELLMLVVRDLTGTLDTEAELARSQRQTEMILRAAAEGVVGVDTAGKVVLVNPSAAQILGYRASDLGGRELHPLIHHSRADGSPFPYEESPIADTLRSGRKHRVRGQVLWAKDGRAVPVDLTTAPVRDGDQLVGAVMTFTDRRPYDALAARHAQLVAMLDESLRGPLDQLRAELGTLADDPAGQLWPEANQILHHLAAGYARMTTLVDNVLAYQRLDAGQDKLVREKAALDEVVAAGVEGAVELIGPGRAQFAVHAPAIEAEVDAEKFAQALAHLIADVAGVDATGSASGSGSASGDSTIVVAAAQRGEVVRIEVRGPYPGGDPVHGPLVRGIVRRHGGVLQTHDLPGASGGKAYVLEVPVSADAGPVPPSAERRGPDTENLTTVMPMPTQRGRGTDPGAAADASATQGGGRRARRDGAPTATTPAEQSPADLGAGAAAGADRQPTGRRRGPARAEEGSGEETRGDRPGSGLVPAQATGTTAPTGRRARREAAPAPAEGGEAPRTAFALPPGDADRSAAPASAPADAGQPTGRRARRALAEAERQIPGQSTDEPSVPRTAFALPPADADRKAAPVDADASGSGSGTDSVSPSVSAADADRPTVPAQPGPEAYGTQAAGGSPAGPYGPEARPDGAAPAARRRKPDVAPVPGVPAAQGQAPAAPYGTGGTAAFLGDGPPRPAPSDAGNTPAPGPQGRTAVGPYAPDGTGSFPTGGTHPAPSGANGTPASGGRAQAVAGPFAPDSPPAPQGQPTTTGQYPGVAGAPTAPAAAQRPVPAGPYVPDSPTPAPGTPTAQAQAQAQAAGPYAPGTPGGHTGQGPTAPLGAEGTPAAGGPGRAATQAQPSPAPSGADNATPDTTPAQGTPVVATAAAQTQQPQPQTQAAPQTAPQAAPAAPPAGDPTAQAQAAPTGRRRARRALAEEPGAASQAQAEPAARPISVRTLGQRPGANDTPPGGTPSAGSGRRRKLANPAEGEREAQAQAQAQAAAAAVAARPHPPLSAPEGRAFAIGAPDEGAEGPEPLDGPNSAVEVVEAVRPPMDDELPPEPLDNPRRLLVWPAPDESTEKALTERGYRPVIVQSREEVDEQISASPSALFVDPLTGPITRAALQSLREAAGAAGVPVLLAAGLGQATREAAYGADPAVLLKALAPRDSEMHPPRVLLIEEHEPIANALTATLERRGMHVVCGATDSEAVTLAAQTSPNLVVMDLMQVRRRRAGIVDWLRGNGALSRTPLVVYTSADIDPSQLPRLASGETVLFLAERSTSAEVQGRIVDLLAKIGTN